MTKEHRNMMMDIRAGSCSNLPYENESMDIVMTCMAFHHFDDRQAFLSEAKRVLKPTGKLYICDPRFPWIIRRGFDLISLIHRINAKFFSNRGLIEYVEKSGLSLCMNYKDLYVQTVVFDGGNL